jgi:replicative DNA helicase
MRLEQKILKNILKDSDYATKVLPYIKKEYFTEPGDRLLFLQIREFIEKYNTPPNLDTLRIELDKVDGVNEDTNKSIQDSLDDFEEDTVTEHKQWILDSTEEFCQERAIYLAMTRSIEIMNGDDTSLAKGAIPELLADALTISFDSRIGHNYFEDWEERFQSMHERVTKIPFDLDILNRVTRGGVEPGTLNMVMGPSGGGKTIWLCHMAAVYASQGKNVLYISMEMDETNLNKRIDCNLFNLNFDMVEKIPKENFEKRIKTLRGQIPGDIVTKRYPTGQAGVNHFRALIRELKLKNKFKPDVIIVDYVNICQSASVKLSSVGTYTYVMKIAEELRALMIEENAIGWTATQMNRSGFSSTDPDADNVSESFGLFYTVDLFLAMIPTEELAAMNQIMYKILKNRYGPEDDPRRFILGLDKSRMKFYNVENSAQEDVMGGMEDTPKNKPTFGQGR